MKNLERLARFGYASKGVVYGTVGVLAVAANSGTDKKDAILSIGSKPFGSTLLLVIAAGLVGYGIYRVFSGLFDAENRGADPKGLSIRAGSILRGAMYWLAAYEVAKFVMKQDAPRGSDAESRHWAARAMDMPYGRWLVGAVGLGLIGYAIYQLYRAASDKAKSHLSLRKLSAKTQSALIGIARFGIATRAVILGVISISVIRAAVRYDPSAAKGTEGAMQQISKQPFGDALLLAAALGLVAYAAYAFINAKYRPIEV